MLLFLLAASVYSVSLLFIQPSPGSLKAGKLPFRVNFLQIRGALFTGLLLMVIHLFVSAFTFKEANETLYLLLAMNNLWKAAILWPYQLFTHLVIHIDGFHLISNVTGIGLASIYERRVGTKRFLKVLGVGALASSPSVFFSSEMATTCGISGGVFALAAAYFTDHKNMTAKEWISMSIAFCILAFLFSIDTNSKSHAEENLSYRTDHMAHILGAVGSILYCRFFTPANKHSQT